MTSKELRELDFEIAEKLMGYGVKCTVYAWFDRKQRQNPITAFLQGPKDGLHDYNSYVFENGKKAQLGICHSPHYTSKIEDAWKIVEAMRKKEWGFCLGLNGLTPRQNGAKFFSGISGIGHSIFEADTHEGVYAVEDTVPLAICKAALLAFAPPSVRRAVHKEQL